MTLVSKCPVCNRFSGNCNCLPEYVQDVYVEEPSTPGYHLSDIPKGELGEISKIREELLELEDAEKQGCKIMALVELSDLYGAISLYLKNHHPGTTMKDLDRMNEITNRAFENGRR